VYIAIPAEHDQVRICLEVLKVQEVLGAFHSTKITGSNFRNFSLVEWNASDRFPEFEVTCSATQGMLGETVVFENGGLFENFRGFRAA